jgi:hypothetical protein
MALSGSDNCGRLPMKPMLVWVVDITETKGEIKYPWKFSRPQHSPFEDTHEFDRCVCIRDYCVNSTYLLPCSLIQIFAYFVCNDPTVSDEDVENHVLYHCYHEKLAEEVYERAKQSADWEYERAKQKYNERAHNRLPLLTHE